MAIRFEQKGEGAFALDVQGYGCPHVQVYTEKALHKLQQGETLTVVFDNPSSGDALACMCDLDGHGLLAQAVNGGVFTWVIRKARAA